MMLIDDRVNRLLLALLAMALNFWILYLEGKGGSGAEEGWEIWSAKLSMTKMAFANIMETKKQNRMLERTSGGRYCLWR